jgi:protocatechuate 3,4-dioxygenase beta subunit
MVRGSWNVPTPKRGAVVKGQVVDQMGRPVPSVLVRLNGYEAITDAQGRYAFRHVSPGRYRINLDENSLPADYAIGEPGRELWRL